MKRKRMKYVSFDKLHYLYDAEDIVPQPEELLHDTELRIAG